MPYYYIYKASVASDSDISQTVNWLIHGNLDHSLLFADLVIGSVYLCGFI